GNGHGGRVVGRRRRWVAAEVQDQSGGCAQIVLLIVAAVSELSHQVFGLKNPDADMLVEVGVHAAAKGGGKRILRERAIEKSRTARRGAYLNVSQACGAKESMDEGRPMLAAMRETRAEEKRVSAAADGGRQVLNAIDAKITDQAEPAIHIARQRGVEAVPVESFFGAGVGAETHKRVTHKHVSDRIALRAAGGRLGLGLRRKDGHRRRKITGGACASVRGA